MIVVMAMMMMVVYKSKEGEFTWLKLDHSYIFITASLLFVVDLHVYGMRTKQQFFTCMVDVIKTVNGSHVS